MAMARPLRLQFPGALYHVTTRGNAKNAIFLDDLDRFRFLDSLGKAITRCGWLCHAYCLMDNHYHVLIETPDGNLARGMHFLNGDYTNRFNKCHEHVGHIFQGRYKAILIHRDSHLLELCRYIVLNPIRAGIVSRPGQYRWSSFSATMGRTGGQPWLSTAWILAQFSDDVTLARARYARFVIDGLNLASVWVHLRGKLLLGSPEFVKEMDARLSEANHDDDIAKCQRLFNRPALRSLFDGKAIWDKAARNTAIAQAYLKYEYTMKAIADHLDLHYSTVSAIIKKNEAN